MWSNRDESTRDKKLWTEGAEVNEAERKTVSENAAGGQPRVEFNPAPTTSFLRLTTFMNHQSARRTRKDQQKQSSRDHSTPFHRITHWQKPISLHIHQTVRFSHFSLPLVAQSRRDSFPLFLIFLLFSLFITATAVDVSESFFSHLYLLRLITFNLKMKTSDRHSKRWWWKNARYLRSHLTKPKWNTADCALSKYRHAATSQSMHYRRAASDTSAGSRNEISNVILLCKFMCPIKTPASCLDFSL